MIRRAEPRRGVFIWASALGAVIVAAVACGVSQETGKDVWDQRRDIQTSLFPSQEIVVPASTHRVPVPVPVGAAFISMDDSGLVRVSMEGEGPLPVGSADEVETYASMWMARLGGGGASAPPTSRLVHAVHVEPGPGWLRVDGNEHTRESMVASLARSLEEAPDRPVGVDPDPACPVDDVVAVLEVLAFAPDFGLPVPRRALATSSAKEQHGASAMGPVLESEQGTTGTVVLRVASGTEYRKVEPVLDALIKARVPAVIFETAAGGECSQCPPPRIPGGVPLSLDPEGRERRLSTAGSRPGAQKGEYTVTQVRFKKPAAEMAANPRTVLIAVPAGTPIEQEPEPVSETEPAGASEPLAARPSAPDQPVLAAAGGGFSEPYRVGGPDPIYPEAARRAGIHGKVVLEVIIGADGRVEKVKVLRGLRLGITESTVDAVKNWRFEPARATDGSALVARHIVTVPFRL